MRPDVRLLEAFEALCVEGSFTRAAIRIGVTQPALTKSIRRLERVLDCELVVRGHHHLDLTASGRAVRDQAAVVLRELDVLVGVVDESSSVRIGFSWSIPVDWFSRQRFLYEARGGTISVHRRDDPIASVVAGEVDVAIHRQAIDVSVGLVSARIATERRVVAVSMGSPLSGRPSLRWEDVKDEPLVVNTRSGSVDQTMWSNSLPGRVVVECDNIDEWLELVAAGRGVGVGPVIARTRAPHPRIDYIDLQDGPSGDVYLTWRSSDRNSTTTRFLQLATQSDGSRSQTALD